MPNITINVDSRDLQNKLNQMQSIMTPERFDRALYRIYNRTGRHVRKILQDDLKQQYHIKPSQVGQAVQSAHVQGNGCIIPVRDKRGNIGSQYSASGGAHGWNSRKRKYRVKSRIVKAAQSTLPPKMRSYGGQPPFRNLSAPDLHGLTFTRKGKKRFPIVKVTGIAIPQMPMNRSLDDVQADIADWLQHQIDQEFKSFMKGF